MTITAYGADDVRNALARTIQVEFPKALTRLETMKGLDEGSLSSVQERPGDTGLIPRTIYVNDVAQAEISRYPAVMIITDGLPRVTPYVPVAYVHDPGEPASPEDGDQYLRTYATTIHAWVMGQDETQLALAKDRFELALWWTLAGAQLSASNIAMDKTSYVVGYQELLAGAPGAMLTGLSARFQIRALETIATPTRGRADTMAADVGLLTSIEGD